MLYYYSTSQLNTVRAKEARAPQHALSLYQKFFQLSPSSLGTKPARYLVTGSLFGWLVTPSIAFSGIIASGFCYLTNNRRDDSSADTRKPPLTKANPEVAMASQNIPPIPLPDNLGNLNSDLDSQPNLQTQIAQAQAELQARIDAVGQLIDAALGVMARLIDELAGLREGR